MISVDEAATRIASAFAPVDSESVDIAAAVRRVLSADAIAQASQPPAAVSSMDGYALRAADAAAPGKRLLVIGTAPAGHPFGRRVERDEAVRIFTGGVVPDGADAIVIQEDTSAEKDSVVLNVSAVPQRHIRSAGLDFRLGDVIAAKGQRLSPRDVSLLAAADLSAVAVRRKPRIVFAATGDELSRPGEARKPGGIVASSGYGLSAMIDDWGAIPVDLGILPDTVEAVGSIASGAQDADLVVTIGGASVGDHDLVQSALGPKGFTLDFWKIAMRPGKPLIFGRLGETPLIGLPGNPVSTLVCAILFVRPAIAALLGMASRAYSNPARLLRALPANDGRQDYLRASASQRDGELWVEPFAIQDSSMLSLLAKADCLIVRKPNVPAAAIGDKVETVSFD
jgi:molybdopterin molybdotransferase